MAGGEYTSLFKVVLIGDSGVGKSNLMMRYAADEFDFEQKSTVGVEFMTKSMKVGTGAAARDVKVQIWDTAGQERFKAISRSIYKGSEGVMLVYDITQIRTFQNIGTWLEEVRVHVKYDGAIILVGNKCDLEDRREVQPADAEKYAKEHGLCFMETSALDNTNVDKAFEWLVQYILDARDGGPSQPAGPQKGAGLKGGTTIKLDSVGPPARGAAGQPGKKGRCSC
eukprot:TRINITY_DN3166_c0_g2_i1.p1 TRINITY_DN3166_c0_g2~~TRINITY_DN3166_c0_g2_i1.p1  ORF type:complete len:264 (+),score=77.33 TRINITY_DN3166_c0_g2_i1:118-792(+)